MRRHLDVIRVDDPCPLPWDALRGDGAVRHCGTCDQSVYDLSAMTEAEAEALLGATAGRLCVQYYQRADGTIVTSDCAPSRLAAARMAGRRAVLAAGALLAGLLAFCLGLAAIVVGWVSEDAAAPVIGKLQKANEVMKPIFSEPTPPPPPPVVEPSYARMRGGVGRIHRAPPVGVDDRAIVSDPTF